MIGSILHDIQSGPSADPLAMLALAITTRKRYAQMAIGTTQTLQ
jgi:hypothetical protein